jgi:hypothetical protein
MTVAARCERARRRGWRDLCTITRCVLVTAALCLTPCPPAIAFDDAPPEIERGEPEGDAERQERQQRAMAGLAAVAGIAIVGVALGTLIILWAGRLRRITREPLPSSRLQNEFWFLRPPKPPVSEHGPEASDEKH